MFKQRGTPFECTLGQISTIISRLTLALPRALELSGLTVKQVIDETWRGDRLALALSEFFRALHKGGHITMTPTGFLMWVPVWKKVKLGVYRSPLEYQQAFTEANTHLVQRKMTLSGSDPENLLRVPCQANEEEIELVLCDVGDDLGFKEPHTSYDKVIARGLEMGLELCPLETIFALRIAFPEQDDWKSVEIAAAPVFDNNGKRTYPVVGNIRGNLWCELSDMDFVTVEDSQKRKAQFVFKIPARI